MIAIIGGTGFYDPDFLKEQEKVKVETKYGLCEVVLGKIGKERVVFLPRHGLTHEIPPHRVNYRRNISALKVAGAERIISINSVGSLDESLPPGSILVPHDFIDLTKGREQTFFDDVVVHVDMSSPYCEEIRRILIKCAERFYDHVFPKGVYVCTQGPRFETASEIKMLRLIGGDVIGMVGFPEVVLSREAGLCYASISTITNYGCGISKTPLTVSEVTKVVSENLDSMKRTIACAVGAVQKKRGCRCTDSLSEAKV
ncbi:MAG: S-methyl-5'-thioadenosine phosphorylase [Candidatus Hydrothermarchaeales archaeon]